MTWWHMIRSPGRPQPRCWFWPLWLTRGNPRGKLPASTQWRRCARIDEAPPPILEARGLTKRYSALTAVRDVSFAIRPRQILGVLGPNGSGKSTIVKMVTGLLEPSRGAVLFHGEPIGRDLSVFKRSLGY